MATVQELRDAIRAERDQDDGDGMNPVQVLGRRLGSKSRRTVHARPTRYA
jgi:hypothetical protein